MFKVQYLEPRISVGKDRVFEYFRHKKLVKGNLIYIFLIV
jgi:hypothetical protein